MKYLLFINILLIATNCGISKKSVSTTETTHCIIQPIKVDSTINYNFKFLYSGNETNGKLLVKKNNEESIKGTIFSENGITLFNVEILQSYAKITYAFENLNNKYIKSNLEEDLKFIFSNSTIQQNKNRKYYISYKDNDFNVSFLKNSECTLLNTITHKDKIIFLNNSPKEIIIKTNVYTISLTQ